MAAPVMVYSGGSLIHNVVQGMKAVDTATRPSVGHLLDIKGQEKGGNRQRPDRYICSNITDKARSFLGKRR